MALIIVRTTDGRSALVHTSQFDRQMRRPSDSWPDVWRRFDAAKGGGQVAKELMISGP